ncbi:MAG: divalent-cation tolerance protein CutA, partial [Verrucomicrobiota bacterium]
CVNVLPGVSSIYLWEGKRCEEMEVLALFKTSRAVAPGLGERLIELHPYEVPEWIVLPLESGSESYLGWVRKLVG